MFLELQAGNIQSQYDKRNILYDVYLNPPYIKGLAPFCRAISTPDGNLYVVDDGMNILHMDIVDWINKNTRHFITGKYHADAVEQGYIPWQKYGRTNKLYLGEALDDSIIFNEKENIKKIIAKLKYKNPKTEFYPWQIQS